MTMKAIRFCTEYLKDFSPARAAKRAGLGNDNPAQMGYAYLRLPAVKKYLRDKVRKFERETEFTAKTILKRLQAAVEVDPADLEDDDGFALTSLSDIPKNTRAAIESFKVVQRLNKKGRPIEQTIYVTLVNRAKSIEMAMKWKQLFAPEQHHHTVGLNWDELYKPSDNDDDAVEEQIYALPYKDPNKEPLQGSPDYTVGELLEGELVDHPDNGDQPCHTNGKKKR